MSADFDDDAAEYVLGTLPHDERTAFALRLTRDAMARAAVAAWETPAGRSCGFDRADRAAGRASWAAIERALSGGVTAAPRFDVVEGGAAGANDRARALHGAVRRWRMTAMVSSALAAALLVFVGLREMGPAPSGDMSYVAAINRGGDKARLAGPGRPQDPSGDRPVRGRQRPARQEPRTLVHRRGDRRRDRWASSIGRQARCRSPDGIKTEAASFAVSVEPPGGSTTGGPDGAGGLFGPAVPGVAHRACAGLPSRAARRMDRDREAEESR